MPIDPTSDPRPLWIMTDVGLPVQVEKGMTWPKRIVAWCHEGDPHWKKFNQEIWERDRLARQRARRKPRRSKTKKAEVRPDAFPASDQPFNEFAQATLGLVDHNQLKGAAW